MPGSIRTDRFRLSCAAALLALNGQALAMLPTDLRRYNLLSLPCPPSLGNPGSGR